MKVRIVKAEPEAWYSDQIGSIFNVKENAAGTQFEFIAGERKFDGYALGISKSDCEILPEEKQPEPFDLERALKGEKVVTREGTEITEIHYFKGAEHSIFNIGAVIKGDLYKFTMIGKFLITGDHHYDLFMAPKPSEYLTKWVNIHFNGAGHYWHGLYNTEEKAKEDIDNDPINKYFATVPITFKCPS